MFSGGILLRTWRTKTIDFPRTYSRRGASEEDQRTTNGLLISGVAMNWLLLKSMGDRFHSILYFFSRT